MVIDQRKFIQEIENSEKQLIKHGGSAWVSGVKEGYDIVRNLRLDIFEGIELTIDDMKNRIEKALKIKETLESWRGCSSCLGEEVEWFNGKCKVYDETLEILSRCKSEE